MGVTWKHTIQPVNKEFKAKTEDLVIFHTNMTPFGP